MNVLFEVHRLNEKGLGKAANIASFFDELLYQVEALCPAGRELALVKTKLEEACFYAKKAMASVTENQEEL